MPSQVEIAIEAINQTQAGIRAVAGDLDRLQRQVSEGFDSANTKANNSSRRLFRRLQQGWQRVGRTITSAQTAMAGFIGVAAGRAVIQAATRMETLRNGLTAIEGSAQEAARQLANLQEIAQLPGIQLDQAVQARISLRAVGIESQLANKTIVELSNAMAQLGNTDLAGVIDGVRDMGAEMEISEDNLDQILTRAPQVATALRKAFGTASAQELQARGVSVPELIARMTDELAKMPRAVGGAANAFSNLQNAMTQLAATLGGFILPTITREVETLNNGIQQLTGFLQRVRQFGIIGARPNAEITPQLARSMTSQQLSQAMSVAQGGGGMALLRELWSGDNALGALFTNRTAPLSRFEIGNVRMAQREQAMRGFEFASPSATGRRGFQRRGRGPGASMFQPTTGLDVVRMPAPVAMPAEALEILNQNLLTTEQQASITSDQILGMANTFTSAFSQMAAATETGVDDILANVLTMFNQIASFARSMSNPGGGLFSALGAASGAGWVTAGAIGAVGLVSVVSSARRNTSRSVRSEPRRTHAVRR